jgi:Zinc finger, C2H2 type
VSKQHVGVPTVVEKGQRVSATAKLRCSLTPCKEQFSDLSHLIKHLKQHLDNGLSVTCPYKNCGKLFKVKSLFSAHLSRKHNKWTISDLADVREVCVVSVFEVDVEQDDAEASVANYHGDAGEPEQEVVQDLAEFKLKYVDSIASFT